MSKVSVNELTEEQIKRIEDIKKRDLVSGEIGRASCRERV